MVDEKLPSSSVRFAAVLVSIVLIGFLLRVAQPLIVPLIVALLFCVALQPLIAALAKRRVPWWATVSVLMLTLLGFAAWGGAALVNSANDLLHSLGTQEPAGAPTEPAAPAVPAVTPAATPQDAAFSVEGASQDLLAAVRSLLAGEPTEQVRDALKKAAPRAATWLVAGTAALFSAATDVVLVLLFMILIFVEQNIFGLKLKRALGARSKATEEALEVIRRDVSRYIALKTILNLAAAIACWIGMAILGVPSSALFALLTFLLGYIPSFGAIIAAIPPIAVSFTTSGGMTEPLILVAIFVVVNVVVGSVLEPALLGKSLHLSTLVIVVAVLAWTALWGFPGMVLGVPLTRSIQLVFYRIPDLRAVAILMSDGEEEP